MHGHRMQGHFKKKVRSPTRIVIPPPLRRAKMAPFRRRTGPFLNENNCISIPFSLMSQNEYEKVDCCGHTKSYFPEYAERNVKTNDYVGALGTLNSGQFQSSIDIQFARQLNLKSHSKLLVCHDSITDPELKYSYLSFAEVNLRGHCNNQTFLVGNAGNAIGLDIMWTFQMNISFVDRSYSVHLPKNPKSLLPLFHWPSFSNQCAERNITVDQLVSLKELPSPEQCAQSLQETKQDQWILHIDADNRPLYYRNKPGRWNETVNEISFKNEEELLSSINVEQMIEKKK